MLFALRNVGLLLAIVCLSVTAACSKGKNEPQLDLTPASGTITLDGRPLADADVTFALQETPPAGYFGSAGRTDAEGKYVLMSGTKKGAVPGTYKVAVSRIEAPGGATVNPEGGMDLAQLAASGEAKQTVPAKYTDVSTTELSATVEKGKTEGYNFDLKGG